MFIHYLITRVNIRVSAYGPEKMDSPAMDDAWLNDRIELFLRFCIPSVLEQTSKNFTWLIYFDPATPSFVFEKLNFLKKESINIEFRFAEDYISMQRDLIHLIKNAHAPFIITTRLDNDDMISKHFIEHVQHAFREKHNVIINFFRGFEYSYHDRILRKWNRRPQNQFISMIEERNAVDVQSVYGFPHWRLPADAEVVNISGDPHWIYLRHQLNYSHDKKNGIPCFTKPDSLELFPATMHDIKLSYPATAIYAIKWFRRMLLRRLKK